VPGRSDVERAFGVLQSKWKAAVAHPIHLINLQYIANLVSSCIMLHNMGVSDRVMGDVNARYMPTAVVTAEESAVFQHEEEAEAVEEAPSESMEVA
jgi:Plant transposon protein